LTYFLKFKIQILKKAHLGFLEHFDMLFLVLQANYGEKISLMQIFSLVNPNAPGLKYRPTISPNFEHDFCGRINLVNAYLY